MQMQEQELSSNCGRGMGRQRKQKQAGRQNGCVAAWSTSLGHHAQKSISNLSTDDILQKGCDAECKCPNHHHGCFLQSVRIYATAASVLF